MPARTVLEGAVAVLCHGGAGTLLGALTCGLPLVCWPQGADQFHNARTCAATGASLTAKDAGEAANALRSVLKDQAYRAAAHGLQRELEAMPSATDCVPIIEELAR